MSELTILQAVRSKGRANRAAPVADDASHRWRAAARRQDNADQPDLRARLKTPLAEERSRVDQAVSVAASAEM
jgi:hypothetical protein